MVEQFPFKEFVIGSSPIRPKTTLDKKQRKYNIKL